MELRSWLMHYLIFIAFTLIKFVICFNIDVEYSVIKQGPNGTFFGFAVAEHQVTDSTTKNVEHWLLVSAPKASNPFMRNTVEAGAVFKCSATNSTSVCKDILQFDRRGSRSTDNKDKQWFGVSLKSGGKDKSVLACAHRYMSYGPGSNFNLLEGICQSMDGSLESAEQSFNPCRDYNSAVKVPSYLNYGQCQTGIGIDIIKESTPSRFLFGSVGVENFEGRAFQKAEDNSDNFLESQKISGMEHSYLGYSMAHGRFLSKIRNDIATGGPRSDSSGKVIILKREEGKMSTILTLPNNKDKVQLASAFGFSLCAYNPDNKKTGYTYLLVGAPFHRNDAPEEGIVYVYLRSTESSMSLVKKLTVKKSRANFGAAIISAGDLNLDGFNDVVVGAPYEEDFAGAVYIFQGHPDGPGSTPSQRIPASKLDSKLRGFGRSLAGGMDLDSNGYDDIVVGAFASDQVALLRSRPVIRIIASIRTIPAKINPDKYKTDKDLFRILVTYRYEEKSKRLSSQIKANMKLVVDPGRTPRIKFRTEDVAFFTMTVRMTNKDRKHGEYAYLVRDKDGKFQSYPDVKTLLTFELFLDKTPIVPNVVTSLDSQPILDAHFKDKKEIVHTFGSSFIEFQRDCDPCIPDLSVKSAKNITIRLRRVNQLDASVENKANSTAFQTDLTIVLPNGISVSSIKLSNGESKLCDDGISSGSGTATTICKNVFAELKSKAKEKFTIILDTNRLAGDVDVKYLTLNVSSANKEAGTEMDNFFTVKLSVVAVADLMMQGNAITRREFYGGKIIGESSVKKDSEVGHVLKHRYFVINNGPDNVPSAVITVHWPIATMSGKHLLYLMDVKSTGANCTFSPGQVNELGLQSSTVPSSIQNTTIAGALNLNSRRRRDVSSGSQVINGTSPGGDPSSKAKASKTDANNEKLKANMEGRILDCNKNTAKCTTFTCKTNNFESRKGVQIEIISRVWNSTLLLDYKGEIVSIVSHASVTVGSNASYIKDPDLLNNKASAFTVLYPETPKTVKERVAVWKIVLAVLAGIILLALLIFGLYKFGFFKRSDKNLWKRNRRAAKNEDDDLLEKKPPSDKD